MNDNPGKGGTINFRGGFSLSAGQGARIEERLDELLAAIPARLIILVDVSGQLVTTAGEVKKSDTDALGSLIAGDLAASQEIARMTGEVQNFQTILREGQRSHIVISEAGDYLILLVQFAKDVPLGWARKMIQIASQEIGEMVMRPVEDDPQPQLSDHLDHDGLTGLFSDALDDLWKG